ncbi:SAM-dependent methyltransferase [Streptomyces cinerochromogenes]|uniref:SAM-dependent methyltransferase n=1 Tax=Streptomyces cinerochromogenes TaxID=66422 RepID=UPI0016703CFB|nr:methyltransferase domain-containing protein [Streptomyces cinerochromogenes]GGT03912.1 methyltransferase type 11 [Streptomyces cinerochromogenes]
MTELHEAPCPAPDDVARMYDHSSALLAEATGDDLPPGDGRGHDRSTSVPDAFDASDTLTGLVADRLALSPGMRVLDFGCGSGRPAVYVARTYDVRVTGVTIGSGQAGPVRAHPGAGEGAGRVTFEHVDAMALPFPDGGFDAVYAIDSLLHMDDRARVIAEAARVLRPGGRLVLANPYVVGALTAAEAGIVAAGRELFRMPPLGDAGDYLRHLAAAGLGLVEILDIGENVRRSHALAAAAIRHAGEGRHGVSRQRLSEAADIIERFAALPQVSYGLIVARAR